MGCASLSAPQPGHSLVLSLAGVCGLLDRIQETRRTGAGPPGGRGSKCSRLRPAHCLCGWASEDGEACAVTVKCVSFPVPCCSSFTGVQQKQNLPRAGAWRKDTRQGGRGHPSRLPLRAAGTPWEPLVNASTTCSRRTATWGSGGQAAGDIGKANSSGDKK